MTNKYLQDLSSQFKNKVVIVTGSTQGSGAEVAKLFAHRGAEGITICGRNEQQGLEIKSEIESIGSKCIYVKADLNEAEECQNIVKKTVVHLNLSLDHRMIDGAIGAKFLNEIASFLEEPINLLA